MVNELEKAISIKNAIDKIDKGKFFLPSIQRRFVWSTKQIEFLFDSIMQGFPINTFMFWEVTNDEIINNFRFYDFLREYYEYQGGINPERNTKGFESFQAVIDGQQRLNSLYIALKGSYAYKRKYKKKEKKDEENYPSRRLFLDILSPIENDEEQKVYDFRFLIHNNHLKEANYTKKKVKNEEGQLEERDAFWFEVGKILEFNSEHDVVNYLNDNNLAIGDFPGKTLLSLFKLIHEKELINFYLEDEQEFNKILFEFIRTNSGGTTLSFADLLMSIVTASWEQGESTKGAREEIDELINEVENIGFNINQDFVLKTCLVLHSDDVNFKLENFKQDTVETIKHDWGTISKCIKEAFELLRSLSFNDVSLRAKNAAIPVIHFLHKTNLYQSINQDHKHLNIKQTIKRYLHLAMLNKLFSGSTDAFLMQLRKAINENNADNRFPLELMVERFRGTPRAFSLSDDMLENLLISNYGSLDTFYLLSLLFPGFNYEFKNPNVDHLFPRNQFNGDNLNQLPDEETRRFYAENWDTVLNLALLTEEQNQSKSDKPLKEWIYEQETHNRNIRSELLIPEDVSLDFNNFKTFIQKRKELLIQKLKEKVD